MRGFLIAGLPWFAIPFTLATTIGLAGLAIGLSLTPEQISSGLVAPNAASQLLGDIGAILIITILFTAVTSAGCAELVAVSSRVTYDVYRSYMKPSATGRELMRISRLSIIIFGLCMGLLALILFHIGINLQYVYLMMGILIGSDVVPILLSLLWKSTNRVAAIMGSIIGIIMGIFVWLLVANTLYGNISISSTGQNIPLLVGNLASISVGGAITVLGSLVKPENFNFNTTKQRILVTDDKVRSMIKQDSDGKFLKETAQFGYKYAIVITLGLVVIWPIPLYFSGYIFSFNFYLA